MKRFCGVDFDGVLASELAKEVRDLNKSIKSILKYHEQDSTKILQEAMAEFKVCNILRWLLVQMVGSKEGGEVLENVLILLVNLTAFYNNEFLKTSCDSLFLESLIALLDTSEKAQQYASMVLINVILEDQSLLTAVTKNGFWGRLTQALVQSPNENKLSLLTLTYQSLSSINRNNMTDLIKNVTFGSISHFK